MMGEGWDYTNKLEHDLERAEHQIGQLQAQLLDVRTIAAQLLTRNVQSERDLGDELMRIVYRTYKSR